VGGSRSVPALKGEHPESLDEDEIAQAIEVIFDKRAYTGPREAQTLAWMIARATDAKGGTFPREMIVYGNTQRRTN
jgi:hypothetical protein